MTEPPRYDRIGAGYSTWRREDPRIAAQINRALGDARSVVNVGAGTGSYEPRDRHVVAIEPSAIMAAQRPRELAPALEASADRLPLRDRSVDAAMAILTLHHWEPTPEAGVRELRRVTRGPVVILTFDPAVSAEMWLMRDYLPELARLDREIFPAPEQLAIWLGGELGDSVSISTLAIAADTPDWTLGSYWAHPERVLDPAARAATSGFARMPAAVVRRVVAAVEADLDSGAWEARNGHLRTLDAYDAGLRLIVAQGAAD